MDVIGIGSAPMFHHVKSIAVGLIDARRVTLPDGRVIYGGTPGDGGPGDTGPAK
jgi:hypothetical protein